MGTTALMSLVQNAIMLSGRSTQPCTVSWYNNMGQTSAQLYQLEEKSSGHGVKGSEKFQNTEIRPALGGPPHL